MRRDPTIWVISGLTLTPHSFLARRRRGTQRVVDHVGWQSHLAEEPVVCLIDLRIPTARLSDKERFFIASLNHYQVNPQSRWNIEILLSGIERDTDYAMCKEWEERVVRYLPLTLQTSQYSSQHSALHLTLNTNKPSQWAQTSSVCPCRERYGCWERGRYFTHNCWRSSYSQEC